jgi:cytochrome c peroxidase
MRNALRKAALPVLLGPLLFTGDVRAAGPAPLELASRCPPSFEQTPANTCLLRTRYERYSSVQGMGLGGTQTALPPHRDGFTPQQIDLGRYLFFDPALSGDGSLSCGSCHQPDQGFSDGLPRSIGSGGKELTRAAPSLYNVAFLKRFFWDARATSLEAQATGPLFSHEEMANTPEQLLATLNGNAQYRRLFAEAFADSADASIKLAQVYLALSAFQTSLISLNSRYDQYAHGYHEALTEPEIEGLNIFRSFVARCAECHTPPLFTNQQVAVIGAPEPEGRALDVGAARTFGADKLTAGFKVPTLRNIALTGPYMHSGVFSELDEVVDFYNQGRGNAVPDDRELHLHWHISSPDLAAYEVERLVDFLHTLTDESLKPRVPERVPSGLEPLGPGSAASLADTTAETGETP